MQLFKIPSVTLGAHGDVVVWWYTAVRGERVITQACDSRHVTSCCHNKNYHCILLYILDLPSRFRQSEDIQIVFPLATSLSTHHPCFQSPPLTTLNITSALSRLSSSTLLCTLPNQVPAFSYSPPVQQLPQHPPFLRFFLPSTPSLLYFSTLFLFSRDASCFWSLVIFNPLTTGIA